MLNKLNMLKQSILLILSLLVLFQLNTAKAFEDQHSIEVLTNILQEPISNEAEKAARDFDDQLMSEERDRSNKIYLVTDDRSDVVNNLVAKLLVAMGEKSDDWVVRVLDTNEPVANAFVTGGKYIYVFTGLMKQATSEDELAFVLSHELGHSLLRHNERRKEDISTSIAGIAKVIGMLSKKKNRQTYDNFVRLTVASYSRLDEEEADAMGVAIARRAGYNSLRGADFFSRNVLEKERSKLENKKIKQENQELINKTNLEVQQSHLACMGASQEYRSKWIKTKEQANRVNTLCESAQAKSLYYSALLQQSLDNSSIELNNSAQEKSNSFFSTHPQDQSRIASITALTDYFNNRRDLDSLLKFKQTYHVMSALNNVNSELLEPLVSSIVTSENVKTHKNLSNDTSLTAQLGDLKKALEKGLITDLEYEKKRLKILNIE